MARVPVKGRAPKTGYDREEYGTSWTDDNNVPFGHNGCDTRNDVLRRDLYHLLVKEGTFGCVALSGDLKDPYTATSVDFVFVRCSTVWPLLVIRTRPCASGSWRRPECESTLTSYASQPPL